MKDYYALLGVEQKATKGEIKKNYRLLANKYHPDKNSEPTASSVFIAITEAYDILSNKKSRAHYDLIRWQELKNKTTRKESFTTVVPPRESTRSTNNKAQQKRSLKYHQSKVSLHKTGYLVLESLSILCRYTLHILGITLIAVILSSTINQFSSGFDMSIGIGIGLCIVIPALLWCIIRIALHIFAEAKKDIALFGIYYKITHKKALQFSLPVFIIVLFFYFLILKAY